jgi:hypothetical protein
MHPRGSTDVREPLFDPALFPQGAAFLPAPNGLDSGFRHFAFAAFPSRNLDDLLGIARSVSSVFDSQDNDNRSRFSKALRPTLQRFKREEIEHVIRCDFGPQSGGQTKLNETELPRMVRVRA